MAEEYTSAICKPIPPRDARRVRMSKAPVVMLSRLGESCNGVQPEAVAQVVLRPLTAMRGPLDGVSFAGTQVLRRRPADSRQARPQGGGHEDVVRPHVPVAVSEIRPV